LQDREATNGFLIVVVVELVLCLLQGFRFALDLFFDRVLALFAVICRSVTAGAVVTGLRTTIRDD
jgi:hypothetical protein